MREVYYKLAAPRPNEPQREIDDICRRLRQEAIGIQIIGSCGTRFIYLGGPERTVKAAIPGDADLTIISEAP